MKKLLLLSFLFWSKIVFSQEQFSNCSAVFLNDQMVVESYSAQAKCKISKDAKGWISVGTVNLGDINWGEKRFEITSKIPFSVAIKDGNTGTITLFSSKIFKKIVVDKIMPKCKKGDSIIIMTTNDAYALPHNDLLVY